MKYNTIQKSEVPSSGLLKRYSTLTKVTAVVYSIVFVLAIANLVGTNALATQGVVLDNILQETEKISKENQILSVEISKISNLSYIESAVTKLGFKRVKSNHIITPVEAVATLR